MSKYFLLLTLTSCALVSPLKQSSVVKGKSRTDYESYAKNFMISTQGVGTTKAAKYAIDRGGNIFDAAIAASFAISVERPHSTGIGGGGFMMIDHVESKTKTAFDFREMAPQRAHSKMFLNEDGTQDTDRSLTGGLASGVPGLVAGLVEVHKKYGSLPFGDLVKPAIDLARKGFKIYPGLAKALEAEKDRLCKFESSKKIFLNEDCSPKKEGEVLIQEDLAKTLELIASDKNQSFYFGKLAKKIANSQAMHGGLITTEDMAQYVVKERKPIEGTYRGYKIVSMPPPSSGGTHIIQILNILENADLRSMGPQSSQAIHLTSSAMQMAFADRAEYMGDNDYSVVPLRTLTSKQYAKVLYNKINPDLALESKDFPIPFNKIFLKEPDHTTHFTIMDSKGNIVSSTQTINGWFGSAVVAEGTGIVMNNEMDDFASHIGGVNLFGAIGGKNNLVHPKKRPLSSMSPTMVYTEKGKPLMALGTPSGTRILTCVMQTILNVLEYDMELWDAVSATRYHHQWYPEYIRVGDPGFEPYVEKQLKELGHKIVRKNLGCSIQAIKLESDGKLHGVSDPRGEGLSLGF